MEETYTLVDLCKKILFYSKKGKKKLFNASKGKEKTAVIPRWIYNEIEKIVEKEDL